MENKARVFISCGQRKNSEEEKIAVGLKEEITKLEFAEPYVAIKEQITKGFKENIFHKLEQSEYFLFIDFKREKIKAKPRRSRGSLFSNQELAIAAYLDKPILAFQEERVKEKDGILSVIQVNPIRFLNRDSLIELIIKEIKGKLDKNEWNNRWRDELVLERLNDDTSSVNYDNDPNKPALFYHIRVNNNHYNKIAWGCSSYIEKITILDTNKDKPLDLVENKWRGVKIPSVSIPPQKYRKFDGFHLITTDPTKIYLGFNRAITDYTGYDHKYRLDIPGKYEITYIVYA